MDVLIVKLSSLGDVVHAMPAVQDIRAALPHARIDWVVESAFAPLAARCAGVREVVPCDLRRWLQAPLSRQTRQDWRSFRRQLRSRSYDAILDLQGLTKSALIARSARVSPGGRRYAMANRTAGSSYEAPTRWVADVRVPVEPRSHAVQRARQLCAQALGYALPQELRFGLGGRAGAAEPVVVLAHGSSREDKLWPETHWLELGRRLLADGWQLALPQGSAAERARSERLALALGPGAQAWPRLSLDALTARMACCAGAVGVDSGLSHIAVALDLPHVQIYNFDTAWRTGPTGSGRQCSVFDHPTPSVDAVWQAWSAVSRPA